jgi:hypothetical protein
MPSKAWVNKALYSIFYVLLDPETHKMISTVPINTNDGIELWELIKTHALGDKEINAAISLEYFQR